MDMTQTGLAAAWDFIARHARPLERARLAHLLDDAPSSVVTDQLQAFRVDGGFGKALESDCRAPEASALAALTALDIMRMHDVPGDDALVAEACAWLVDTVETDNEGRLVWPFLPASAQASPHAPWWDQSSPGQLSDVFDGFVVNPGVAILAHLWRHERAAPGEVNAHDALAHLVGEPSVPDHIREPALDYLRTVLPDRVLMTDFTTYGIDPLWIAPYPDHPLAETLTRQVSAALDHTVCSQEPDGSWKPTWDWGGAYPDGWAIAEVEWRGSLIVRNLAALLHHGRLEPT